MVRRAGLTPALIAKARLHRAAHWYREPALKRQFCIALAPAPSGSRAAHRYRSCASEGDRFRHSCGRAGSALRSRSAARALSALSLPVESDFLNSSGALDVNRARRWRLARMRQRWTEQPSPTETLAARHFRRWRVNCALVPPPGGLSRPCADCRAYRRTSCGTSGRSWTCH